MPGCAPCSRFAMRSARVTCLSYFLRRPPAYAEASAGKQDDGYRRLKLQQLCHAENICSVPQLPPALMVGPTGFLLVRLVAPWS